MADRAANVGQISRVELFAADGSIGVTQDASGGDESDRTGVSVVPLESADDGPRAVLIVLGKREMCESLSVQGFARFHHLTGAEVRVLKELCNGVPPAQIAALLGVAISTVRSQIGSMRAKTGAESIRALVRQVAVLLRGALLLALRRAVRREGRERVAAPARLVARS